MSTIRGDADDVREVLWDDNIDTLTHFLDDNPSLTLDTENMIYAVQVATPEEEAWHLGEHAAADFIRDYPPKQR